MKKIHIIFAIIFLVIAAIALGFAQEISDANSKNHAQVLEKEITALQTKLAACTKDSDCIDSKIDTGFGCYTALINKSTSQSDINELKNLAAEYTSLHVTHIGLDCPPREAAPSCASNSCTYKWKNF